MRHFDEFFVLWRQTIKKRPNKELFWEACKQKRKVPKTNNAQYTFTTQHFSWTLILEQKIRIFVQKFNFDENFLALKYSILE